MAKLIARQYLDLPAHQILPLSVSHGIDFGHESLPQDVQCPEPIHWAYNVDILRRSSEVKAALALPHSWLMLHEIRGRPSPARNGKMLVIGPPPSEDNDRNLASVLERNDVHPDAILIKKRNDAQVLRSCEFWEARGVHPVTAGSADNMHFHRMMDLLLQYEWAVSPVLSSVTVLASAIGSRVTVLRDYEYCTYSSAALDFERVCAAPTVRELVATYLAHGESSVAIGYSRDLLGERYLGDRAGYADKLQEAISRVQVPIHVPAARGIRAYALLLGEVALRTKRSAFLRYGPINGLRYHAVGTGGSVVCKKMNMIDAATSGLSEHNFAVRPLRVNERRVQSGQGANW